MPPFQKTIEHDYSPSLIAARNPTINPAEKTQARIETGVVSLPIAREWEDEEYPEPDFKPPDYTFELQMGTTQIQLKSSSLEDRIQLQIAAYGSRYIQLGNHESSSEDGWFEITEATDEHPARMIFSNNHYSFESRYRIGYSRLLELRRTAVDHLNTTGRWQRIVDSPEQSHQRVIEAVVDKLPSEITRRVSFDSDGFVRGANRVDREEISIYTTRLTQNGIDFRVCYRPLNGSFILINKLRTDAGVVSDVAELPCVTKEEKLAEVIDIRNKVKKVQETVGYFGFIALSAGN